MQSTQILSFYQTEYFEVPLILNIMFVQWYIEQYNYKTKNHRTARLEISASHYLQIAASKFVLANSELCIYYLYLKTSNSSGSSRQYIASIVEVSHIF